MGVALNARQVAPASWQVHSQRMGTLDRRALYTRIADILGQRKNESLLDAASRVVRGGRH